MWVSVWVRVRVRVSVSVRNRVRVIACIRDSDVVHEGWVLFV